MIEASVLFDSTSITIIPRPAGFVSELLSLGARNVTDLSKCWALSQSGGYFMLNPVIISSYVRNSESKPIVIIGFSWNEPRQDCVPGNLLSEKLKKW